MYLTRGMTCAKALRQEVFPVRKKVMAGFCPAGYPTTSLFEYLLLVAPEIMGNSHDHDPGCQPGGQCDGRRNWIVCSIACLS